MTQTSQKKKRQWLSSGVQASRTHLWWASTEKSTDFSTWQLRRTFSTAIWRKRNSSHHGKVKTTFTGHQQSNFHRTSLTSRTFHCTFRTSSVTGVGLLTIQLHKRDSGLTCKWVTWVVRFTRALRIQTWTKSITSHFTRCSTRLQWSGFRYLWARTISWMCHRTGRVWLRFGTKTRLLDTWMCRSTTILLLWLR
jgi:hypothetical protein